MYGWISNVIAAILLLVLVYRILKDYKEGLLFYFAACLVGPYLIIGTTKVKFEMAAFLIVFVMAMLRGRFVLVIGRNRRTYGRVFLAIWFGLFSATTIFNLLGSAELSFFPSRIFGLFRFIFNLFILEKLMEDRAAYFREGKKVYRVFLIVNLPVLISQYMIPGTLQFYNTLFGVQDSAPYANEIRIGFYTRGYGTSYSPTGLGMICAFIVAFFVMKYCLAREKDDIKLLALGIIEGALSGSKMFAFSIIIIIALSLVVLPIFNGGKSVATNIRLLVGGSIFLGIAMLILMRFNQLDRLLNYFANPLEQLESRYSSTGSIGRADKTVLVERFFGGYGATKKGTELIGDSMYYVLFHDIGLLGAIWYFGCLAVNFVRGIGKRDFITIVYVALIIGMGVGDPLYFTFFAVIPTYYLLFINGNEIKHGNQRGRKQYVEKSNM